MMRRLLLSAVITGVAATQLFGQSAMPPAETRPEGAARALQGSPSATAAPSASRSSASVITELVSSLSPAELQTVLSLIKSNFVNADTLNDAELARATVQGLLARLPHGLMLLTGKENPQGAPPGNFYSEIIGEHTGYVRLGSLTNGNLQALDKSLSAFTAKKLTAIIVDLRASQSPNDLAVAAEVAKRFCPKGKVLFTVRRPTGRDDRVFTSDRDPAFRGLLMILADGDTSGPAEALASALRFYGRALIIGGPTAGRAAEYSDFPLGSDKILRVAVAEMISPDGRSLFPQGLKPDLPVEMPATEKRQIFQLSPEKGMASFIYEPSRPHMNEAALLAGTNPEVEAAEAAQQRRGRPPEKAPLHDPVLERALDVVTSLEVYQKR